MNSHSSQKNWIAGNLAAAIALSALSASGQSAERYTAHEWGTFTSVQGSDGALLEWRPLETSSLPDFVYDWSKPGFNRVSSVIGAGGKGAMVTLQRMETPVVYFYTDRQMTVDVKVKFPKGTITEWYPQADFVGPSAVPAAPASAVEARSASGTPAARPTTSESAIAWSGVKILPLQPDAQAAAPLPRDASGSHYFAARETDANVLFVADPARTNATDGFEKFLFYRGVGSFVAPLRVTAEVGDSLTLVNLGQSPLTHLFALRTRDGLSQVVELDGLSPQAKQTVSFRGQDQPKSEVAGILAAKMAAALVSESLFPREAQAMVNTWKDSWFAEDGVRVLYTLPRAWTDATLPMTLDPQPGTLVRVMVGRAEVITHEQETRLRDQLIRAQAGDVPARQGAIAELQKLGRFAEPAIRRITGNGTDAQLSQLSLNLLPTATLKLPLSAL